MSTNAAFAPVHDANYKIVGNTGGDYNADGENYGYPMFLRMAFPTAARTSWPGSSLTRTLFPAAAFGQQDSENFGGFGGPAYFDVDAGLLKDTTIPESLKLQLRFELFTALKYPNPGGVDTTLPDGTFGRSTSQLIPRWIRLGANLKS